MASGNTLLMFSTLGAEFPSTLYASLTLSNDHPVLEFADGINATTYFRGVMPRNYAGGGVTINIFWKAASAVSGAVVWSIAWERLLGFDTDAGLSFATDIVSAAVTTAATAGIVNTSVIAFTNAQIDGVAAGEPFRIRLTRVTNNAGDTMADNAHFMVMELRET